MEYKGYKFWKKRTCKKTDTVYYSCSRYESGYEGRLIAEGGIIDEKHSLLQLSPHAPLNDIPRMTAVSIIKNTRAKEAGADVFKALELLPMRNVSATDSRSFMQFRVVHTTATGGMSHRIVSFAHPGLVRLLRYPKISVFVDGTFKVVPRPFTQCLIVMVYDASVDVYVPCSTCSSTARRSERTGTC